MDLTTRYLGLTLANPFLVGASPLASSVDKGKRLEDAGAGAVVLHSLFEEQILWGQEQVTRDVDVIAESFPEALSYLPRGEELKFRAGPEEYLEQIAALKGALAIPVIGSLNGVSLGGWTDHAQRIAEAGADALELNLYLLPSDPSESGAAVEERLLQVVRAVRSRIGIPLAVKLSPFFSSLPHFVVGLEGAGANGAVLFNRFYQPDIDVEALEVVPTLHLSDPSELLLRLRWLAVLAGRTGLTLCASGGVHRAEDALKALMAGADAVQLVSALLRNGPAHLGTIRSETEAWLEAHEYESLAQLRGSMSLAHCPDPAAYERANYLRVLHGWHPPTR